MARDFSKNTSNHLRLGVNAINPRISGAAAISVHAMVFPDSFNTSADNNLVCEFYINNGGSGVLLGIHNGSSAVVRVAGRSQTSDSYQVRNGTTALVAGSWYSVGGALNFAGDLITPYYNGVAENGGAASFGAFAYTPGTPVSTNDAIGGNHTPTSALQFDGRIAEFAVWKKDIGAAGFRALAGGVSALLVCHESLVFYMPLLGGNSPERDLVGGLTGTITGSIPSAPHPRVYSAARHRLLKLASGVGPPPAPPFRGLAMLGVGS